METFFTAVGVLAILCTIAAGLSAAIYRYNLRQIEELLSRLEEPTSQEDGEVVRSSDPSDRPVPSS